jgi:hypothetical protein
MPKKDFMFVWWNALEDNMTTYVVDEPEEETDL